MIHINRPGYRTARSGLCLALLLLAGCPGSKSRSLDGVYHTTPGGPITITLKDGKAKVDVAGEAKTLDYRVDGDKLTILNPQEGNVEMTINADGTLTGQLGVFAMNAP